MSLCELKKNVPPEYQNFKIEEMYGKPEIIDPIKETLSSYLKNSAVNEQNGRGLLFLGRQPGNGKTYSAYHILGEVAKDRVKWDRKCKQLTRGYTDIASIIVPDFLKHCNRFESPSVTLTQEVMTCSFLLLDELSPDSFKNNLESAKVDLFSLVDYRVSYNLPTLYTSNCTSLEELKKLVGPKLFDRIAYKTTVINFSGPSIRPVVTEKLKSELDIVDEALTRGGTGMSHTFLVSIASLPIGIAILAVIVSRYNIKAFHKKVEYLSDSPFPYSQETDNGDEYVVFDLGEGTTLWCDYNMGIRSDGVYGLNFLLVKGLNGRRPAIKLNIGQSVFPIIEKLDRFQVWMDGKTFQGDWDKEFINEWTEMKKKLDNLRYLETKSKEKEKKDK